MALQEWRGDRIFRERFDDLTDESWSADRSVLTILLTTAAAAAARLSSCGLARIHTEQKLGQPIDATRGALALPQDVVVMRFLPRSQSSRLEILEVKRKPVRRAFICDRRPRTGAAPAATVTASFCLTSPLGAWFCCAREGDWCEAVTTGACTGDRFSVEVPVLMFCTHVRRSAANVRNPRGDTAAINVMKVRLLDLTFASTTSAVMRGANRQNPA